MATLQTQQPIQEKAFAYCKPCLDRGKQSPATRVVASKPWCEKCFNDDDERPATKGERLQRREIFGATIRALRKENAQDRQGSRELFVAPYLPYIHRRLCGMCGEKVAPNKTYCETCSELRDAIAKVRHWLRRWQDTGSNHKLSNAISIIKRFGLTVDDFKRY